MRSAAPVADRALPMPRAPTYSRTMLRFMALMPSLLLSTPVAIITRAPIKATCQVARPIWEEKIIPSSTRANVA